MAKKHIPNYSNVNKLLEREKLKRLEHKIDEVLPNIYACFAIVLMDEKYGFSKQDIADLFAETGAIWNECSEKKVSMREWCQDLCKIDVMQMARGRVPQNRAEQVEIWNLEGNE